MAINTLKLEFDIDQQLRYLSHRQTMKFFQRAFLRAGIDICFSEGFNPRPRMSLPLPRPVGICTKDDLLTAQIESGAADSPVYMEKLNRQMPDGCRITRSELFEGKVSFLPVKAMYRFCIEPSEMPNVEIVVEDLKNKKQIIVEREDDKGNRKTIEAAGLIEDVVISGQDVIFTCLITNQSSLRVDEMLCLLKLSRQNLTCPVERSNICWQKK